jgi:GT2 family glycosyltransferase
MKLSITTINYNESKTTIRLLKSLAAQTDQNFDVFVIDNFSQEKELEVLKTFISEMSLSINLLEPYENLGFSGGNNIGIKKALKNGSDWVLLLNNDIQVENGFIAQIQAKLSHSEAGIWGIPLIEQQKTVYCGKIRWLSLNLTHVTDPEECTSSESYIVGGAMAVHKDVFKKAGFLDERYFLYFEDAEFSLRVKKKAFSTNIAKDIRVRHWATTSTKKLGQSLLLRYHARNAMLFNAQHAPWYIKIFLPVWPLFVILKQIIKLPLRPERRKKSRAILNGVMDFYRGRFGRIL